MLNFNLVFPSQGCSLERKSLYPRFPTIHETVSYFYQVLKRPVDPGSSVGTS